MAPKDQAVALTLAAVYLSRDPRHSIAFAAEVIETAPNREAWLCLIAARHRAGEIGQALVDLGYFLSHFTVDAATASLADIVCSTGNMQQGWCGIDAADQLLVTSNAALILRLDGRAVRRPPARLPRSWSTAVQLHVSVSGGNALIGSPLDLAALRRIEGVVEPAPDGGVQGWCWQPAAPENRPRLELRDAVGYRLLVAPEAQSSESGSPFARRHRFGLPSSVIAGLTPPLRLLTPNGWDLLGSPLDPGMEARSAQAIAQAQSTKPSKSGMPLPPFTPTSAMVRGHRTGRGRKARGAIVIPIFNGGDRVVACLESVISCTPRPVPIIVVDDGSTEPRTVALLDRLAAEASIRLVRHPTNRGFPAAANTGIRAAEGHDVILLNSDVLTPPGWFEVVRAAAYSAADVGTASPLSNDATILNYPGRSASSAPPGLAATIRLARLAARAAGDAVAEVPTTVGFCMYIRRDCLDDVGNFREDLFAQGYGEENDFCLRARHLGWRHVAALGTYVAHAGGLSFGAAKQHLIERNLAILEKLHPGWLALVEAHAAADPLFEARRRIDRLRWRDHLKRHASSVILVTHDDGGGVERVVRGRLHALAEESVFAVLLRPVDDGSVRVLPGLSADLPDLRYRLPHEMAAFVSLLRTCRPQRIEFHHLLGHPPEILELPRRLDVPYDVVVHDYAWLCPRVTLLGREGRYCGEPDPRECDRCVADNGRLIEEDIDTASLRRRSAGFLSGAAKVTAPSTDTRDRLRRHFPQVSVEVVGHEDEEPLTQRAAATSPADLVIAVVGALGVEKGYEILLGAARDAADRSLALRYVLIGHSIDDPRLLQTGRCFITGPYQEGEAQVLIRHAGAQLGLVPSVWPETWCFALSEIWRAGLPAACFDIGAPAERIRAKGAGFVLPLGLGATALNNALLAGARRIGHV